jgi:hypothetical protein
VNRFFLLDPEVAGGLGPHTIMDRSAHPPVVTNLHYVFEGWLGDELVQSFPCFLVTERLSDVFAANSLTGFDIAEAEVSTSEQFKDCRAEGQLPPFRWLKIVGAAGRDDFGIGPDFRLTVSEKALSVIRATKPRGLDVEAL